MRHWSLLADAAPRPGWFNMALDQALLDRAEQTGAGTVRLYAWDPHCLSFGRHEPALRRYDRSKIEALGLDTVRRPTGGRAVWHAREITYAVAAPIEWFGGMAEAYDRVHATLRRALHGLGVAAEPAPRGRMATIGAGACFATHVGGEVLVAGRKLIGSAQLRQGLAFLQHGSLLLDGDQGIVAEVTLGTPPDGGETTLRRVRADPDPLALAEIVALVAAEFRSWAGEWVEGIEPEIATQMAPHATRFQDPGWTWRR